MSRHLGTIRVRQDEFRFVLDTHGRGGCYYPILHCFQKGPNGSVAGIGPKTSHTWTLPHLPWHTAYRLRKVGAIRVYQVISRMYRRIEKKR